MTYKQLRIKSFLEISPIMEDLALLEIQEVFIQTWIHLHF